jgi:magnesium-protoporphyrin O-methyltransferase
MPTLSYLDRREKIESYFDGAAAEAWSRLTSDAPVSGVRATVRAGRDRMRATLLSWLPQDMRGARLLDAGCGTGALSIEAARRGAQVVAIDLSPKLIALAKARAPEDLGPGAVHFLSGDMLDPALGRFDYAVGMDSLIHYRAPDATRALAGLAARCHEAILFTFAPRTALLSLMHAAGRLFPRGDRAPAIEPVSENRLRSLIAAQPGLQGWRAARTQRVASGFYTSQAMELRRA